MNTKMNIECGLMECSTPFSSYSYNPLITLSSAWFKIMRDLAVGCIQPGRYLITLHITSPSTAISYYGNAGDGVTHADEETLQRIDEAYNTLLSSKSRSLLKKYLTRDVYDKIKDRVTPNGASLLDVINSGVENVDSNIGIYAPDAESYSIFSELFDPVIDEYHGGFSPNSCHPGLNFGHANSLGDLNSKGDFVVSTRVRCARSIEGYPFNPLLTNEHYAELEQDIARALESLDQDLSGQYTTVNRLSPKDQDDLLERHLLFKQGDRFLQAAGACRYWPDGRGIFLNDDSTLVVWVNEEDHMRIISMQSGGDLGAVYERFTRAVTLLGQKLPFSSSQRFGFLTFCPTNLGTAIRASVHIRLPNLGEDRRILEDTADRFNLQVRGTSGEHSEAKDFVFDISNRRRLGLTEIEALQEMYDGVQEIINMEIQMSEGKQTSDMDQHRAESSEEAQAEEEAAGHHTRRSSTTTTGFPGMWTEEGQYLTQVLGDALIRGLSDVNRARPKDPISRLACCLYSYRYINPSTPDSPAPRSPSVPMSGGSDQSTIAMQNAFDQYNGNTDSSYFPLQTRDRNGQSILHYAAATPHRRGAFFRLIAESGCNLAYRNHEYQTARDVASEAGIEENVMDIDKWIIRLAVKGRCKDLDKLLVDGYDHLLDIEDEDGNNILFVAEAHGQEKTVEYLRSALSFEEKRDWLHKAIRVGSLAHVDYILDSERLAHARDRTGRSALHIATLCEEKEIMEFIALKFPSTLGLGDNLERTALHYAMAVETVDQVAKVLVQAGAKRTIKDLRGKHPSYYFMNRADVVNMIKEIYE
ncbi:uncharacterized protein LOC143019110 [Oratosquilla oratoria]|uniref:uncharacterized protein LOC143019110 n=1 Tax=Oratosquilla oratoria TaxID=337810 RepID=UPI003F7586BF